MKQILLYTLFIFICVTDLSYGYRQGHRSLDLIDLNHKDLYGNKMAFYIHKGYNFTSEDSLKSYLDSIPYQDNPWYGSGSNNALNTPKRIKVLTKGELAYGAWAALNSFRSLLYYDAASNLGIKILPSYREIYYSRYYEIMERKGRYAMFKMTLNDATYRFGSFILPGFKYGNSCAIVYLHSIESHAPPAPEFIQGRLSLNTNIFKNRSTKLSVSANFNTTGSGGIIYYD